MSTLAAVRSLDAGLIALAAFRLTRLVTSDTITTEQRNAVIRWSLQAPAGPRRRVAELVECNYCAGYWVTLAVFAAWHVPTLRPVVRAFGYAGAQALLSAGDVALNDSGGLR